MLHHLYRAPRPEGGLAIFGAGAAGREIAWLAQQCWGDDIPLTFLVDKCDLEATTCNGISVAHFREFAERSRGTPVLVAIGDPALREDCVQKCSEAGFSFASLVHPRVEASRWVSVGAGTMICAGAILTTNVTVGQHVYINIGCTISHDASIGDYTTLSPGAHVAGWVTLGRRVFVGTGAVVINGSSAKRLTIGDNAVVGAGACVTHNVDPGTTVVGVPARSPM